MKKSYIAGGIIGIIGLGTVIVGCTKAEEVVKEENYGRTPTKLA